MADRPARSSSPPTEIDPAAARRRSAPLARLATILLLFVVVAAASQSQEGSATVDGERRCALTVELDPATGRIAGEAVLEVPDVERFLTSDGSLPIALDPRLVLDRAESGALTADGAAHVIERNAIDDRTGLARWTVALPAADRSRSIALRWSGVLRDDVRAGEAPGRIHNTRMRAHVGEDGVYLAPDSAWHPVLDAARSTDWSGPDGPLCRWTLEATAPVPLVASGDRILDAGAALGAAPTTTVAPAPGAAAAAAAVQRWSTPFGQPAVALAGGPLVAFERAHGAVQVRALLRPASASHAPRLLDAVASYLDMYQPLVGAYPFREFAVVENFFSSGFAFPGFTLLSSQVIEMGERGLRPGYLDHELLHNWWGNGVLASRASGHWAEALATYCANYMRPVLEGRSEQGRAQRRSVAEALSASPKLAAQAVGDFGLDDSISTFVGYQKGAMVFAQLAARIGQDRLWSGLRRFYRDRLGQPSTWDDLRRAFEAESGADLASFFTFWIAGPGLPAPRLEGAVWDDVAREVRIGLDYRDPVSLDLPLRLRFAEAGARAADSAKADRPVDHVTIHPGDATLSLASDRRPIAIEIDPEFETLRSLPPELLMPTLSGLAPPTDLMVIAAEHDLDGYRVAQSAIEERYGKSGQIELRRRFEPALLDRGHVLALGLATLDPELQSLFEAERVKLWDRGFEVEAVRYVSDSDALLACVRNPRRAGAFVCLYWANTDEGLARADLLPYYGGNSLLVFDRGQPFVRRDFEAIERIEVR